MMLLIALQMAITQTPSAQQVAIRPLGRIVATSRDSLASIAIVRPLSDGRVLVDDPVAKRLVLLDSSLSSSRVIVDTTSETAKAYGAKGGALIAYFGDSSLFADVASLGLLVVDPAGKIARVMAAPLLRGGSLVYVLGPEFRLSFDGRGDLVGRWLHSPDLPRDRAGQSVSSTGLPTTYQTLDSAQIERANIATKRTDTVALLAAAGGQGIRISKDANGAVLGISMFHNPVPVSDAWTVMGDGTLAVIREVDYHVDWYGPDGNVTSTPRIQHTWEHLTDSMREAILDSAKRADSLALIAARARADSVQGMDPRLAERRVEQQQPPVRPVSHQHLAIRQLTHHEIASPERIADRRHACPGANGPHRRQRLRTRDKRERQADERPEALQ